MDLSKLKQHIPYRWRIQTISRQGNRASVVAYIDARDVMNILDNSVGAENWQDAYWIEGDLLIAGIGIRIDNEWIWKHDTGTRSNVEEEKGQLSDAFKRAGVKWGIGRFLYDIDIQWINLNKDKRPVDEQGNIVWDITEYINNRMKRLSVTPR